MQHKRTLGIGALVVGALIAAGCNNNQSASGAATSPSASTSAPAQSGSAPAQPATATLSAVDTAKNAAKAMADAFNAHDAKKLASLYAEDAEVRGFGEHPEKGRADIAQGQAQIFQDYPDAKLAFGRIFVTKGQAAMEWLFTGNHVPDAHGVKLAQTQNGFMGASVVTFNDAGLISREEVYFDDITSTGHLDPKLIGNRPTRPPVSALPNGTDVLESKGTPDEAKAIAVADQLWAAIESGKADDATALYSDQYLEDSYHESASDDKAAQKQDLVAFSRAFSDVKATKGAEFAAGDLVVRETTVRAVHTGALGQDKPTKRPMTQRLLEVMQIKDGKVLHLWAWGNNAEVLKQLGLWTAPGGPAAPTASGSAGAAPTSAPAPTTR